MFKVIDLLILLPLLVTLIYAGDINVRDIGIPGTLVDEDLPPYNYSLEIPKCDKNIGPICSDDCRSLMVSKL